MTNKNPSAPPAPDELTTDEISAVRAAMEKCLKCRRSKFREKSCPFCEQDDTIRCPACKADRVYGETCTHCGDTFKAHPTVMEHLAAEKKAQRDPPEK